MNIYLIELKEHNYDEFDSFVVASKSILNVKKLIGIRKEQYPYVTKNFDTGENLFEKNIDKITKIGIYYKEEEEVILSSFNAG